ncbi:MAG: aminomethyl-transferring glycine dehydrogenase subunit GcvPA, partial [Thermodesulfobacteriota bacterium]
MRYLPHTKEDIDSMLEKIGKPSIDSLFDSIPDQLKTNEPLDLPDALTEWELDEHMLGVEQSIIASGQCTYFIGAGSYDHYIPHAVKYLISRSEFMTAYTPYQPEVSQGTLQGIYEFQTMIAELTGMDVATASHYDCGTALAEALLIAVRKKKKKKVAVSSLIHPAHKQIINTYLAPGGYELLEIPYNEKGLTDFSKVPDDDIAAIAVQSPNFFGNIEPMELAKKACDDKKVFFVASFTEAMSLGLLKSPGSYGADLVAGEGQSLGLAKSFGGPGLGLLAGTNKQMRNLPGRLVGKTTDTNGDRGYVLTLATREQHIRREKASSNICSNNGLNALTAAMYLASAGKT